MNILESADKAVDALGKAASIFTDAGIGIFAREKISYAKDVLQHLKVEVKRIEGEKILAESERDSLLFAIGGTQEGRTLDVSQPHDVIQHAVAVIRIMDAEIKSNREIEEIPFGTVEPDGEKMKLERRVAELELQFEFKVDELAEAEKELREFKERLGLLVNLVNKLGHGEKNHSRKSVTHELKILPEYFEAVFMGIKKAEIRQTDRLDRLFSVGDELFLREWSHDREYTGRETYRVITHITDLKDYAPGYVMLSIEPM